MHHTTVNKYLENLIDNQIVNLRILDKKNLYCLNTDNLDNLTTNFLILYPLTVTFFIDAFKLNNKLD